MICEGKLRWKKDVGSVTKVTRCECNVTPFLGTPKKLPLAGLLISYLCERKFELCSTKGSKSRKY